jgi:hypothetical protein
MTYKMMDNGQELMDQLCKFKVGDTVAVKAQVDACAEELRAIDEETEASARERHPDMTEEELEKKVRTERRWARKVHQLHRYQRCVVLERMVQQCYGGLVQVHYLLSATGASQYGLSTTTGFKLTEPELVPYPEEA